MEEQLKGEGGGALQSVNRSDIGRARGPDADFLAFAFLEQDRTPS
ncbi:hypothetical protein [Sporisorium scitamineum]|uniref:Uncharacterized protein n=1 Tax=Sporisorium scitamineum TaxID=49012 RepID=A0A0F7RTY7_9BASI|nr:hypothetical protein [Sporisorium scitamineum]